MELRGEVMMTAAQFEHACAKRPAHDGTTFANPRSAAAGTLRAQDRPYVCELTFFGYGALPLPDDSPSWPRDCASWRTARSWRGSPRRACRLTAVTDVGGIVATSLEQVQERVEQIAAKRGRRCRSASTAS